MFTCSSCGYEANPDSAPACSLCGSRESYLDEMVTEGLVTMEKVRVVHYEGTDR